MTAWQVKALRYISDGRTHSFGYGYGMYRRALRRLSARGWVQVNRDGDRDFETYVITDTGRAALANLED